MKNNLEKIIANRYRLIEQLGQGGSAITYKAEDLQTGIEVAIKELSFRKLDDWQQVELFESEAKMLQHLDHHSIPKYIDFFQLKSEDIEKSPSNFYIVEQLARGKSLTTLIEEGWQPTEKTVRYIANQILEILVYLQNLIPPIIHRDIKPDNIIYNFDKNDQEGEIFLVDFGTVQETYRNTITASLAVGTPDYMAPEQMAGRANLSTDLYGLGMTIIFLLTGKSPILLPQTRLKTEFRRHVNISLHFANWIDKMIDPKSENRFNNAQSALDVLQWRKKIKNFTDLREKCAEYTSIYINKTDEKLLITIPPTIFHKRFNGFLVFLTFFWNIIIIIYSLGLFLSVNSIVGIVFLLFSLLDISQLDFFRFKKEIFAEILLLISLTIIIFYFPFFVFSDKIMIFAISLIIIDLFFMRKLRIFMFNEIFFTTQIKISQSKLTIIRNIFNIFDLTINENVNQSLNVKLFKFPFTNIIPKAITIKLSKFKNNENKKSLNIWQRLNNRISDFNYKFGRFLTTAEQIWIKEEIKRFIKKDQ